ncbi:ATP-binding protein [Reinekea marinisedimentorum]|uniref:histidine kinase n=1 Tax=Reinekea marinisedimentorum TaxID=230495 RepID=A0A4R3HZU1_9GAMM|nr:ATP-binding protein [Reinekea marinisedimentorum]TCS38778.1 two-component system sensor histidine kinase BaeS [Reinekea marinisedimentorum]
MAISRKLFLSFMGLTLIILLATLSLARWSFNQGFINYFQAIEERRLEYISEDLIDFYQRNDNSWDALTSERMYEIVSEYSATQNVFPANTANDPIIPDFFRDNLSGRGGGSGPPRPFMDQAQMRQQPPPDTPPSAVYDVDGSFIAGFDFDQSLKGSLEVAMIVEGEFIGTVKSMGVQHTDFDLAEEFSEQQLLTSLLIGVFSLSLAIGMSLWLAKLFLNPMKVIEKAITGLSDGDYSTRLNDARTDEFGRMMRDIDHLSVTLEQNRSTKNRWLADISHELRTPLTILGGEIEMLQEGLKPFDETQLESLHQETQRMRHLVDDLYQLSLSDIGGLRYNFEPVSLARALGSAASACQSKIREKGLSLVVNSSDDAIIRADEKRLEQLFINLLINAAAYTDGPGRIVVDIESAEGEVVVNFNDTKPSVTEDECQLLLEPLYRTDMSRTRRGEGAGLGLTICKNIVDAHAGSIKLMPSKLGGLHVEIKFKIEDKSL